MGGFVLLAVSLFMLLGVVRSGVALGSAASVIAMLVTVVLPAAGGVALVAGHRRATRGFARRREQLRSQTVDAELLRLAGRLGGRLTVVEVVRDLAITPEEAKAALDALHSRDLAEIEITDSGVIVYAFRDVQRLHEKESARGLLDG